MDLSIIIIGLISVCIIFSPILYLATMGSNKKRKLFKALTQFAESKSCKISEYDQWKESCIGYDKDKRKIFHVMKKADNYIKTEINLSEVSKCTLVGVNMTGNTISNKHNSIDEIELCFKYHDEGKPETSIEFFRLNTDFNIGPHDLKLAEKWLKNANSTLVN